MQIAHHLIKDCLKNYFYDLRIALCLDIYRTDRWLFTRNIVTAPISWFLLCTFASVKTNVFLSEGTNCWIKKPFNSLSTGSLVNTVPLRRPVKSKLSPNHYYLWLWIILVRRQQELMRFVWQIIRGSRQRKLKIKKYRYIYIYWVETHYDVIFNSWFGDYSFTVKD